MAGCATLFFPAVVRACGVVVVAFLFVAEKERFPFPFTCPPVTESGHWQLLRRDCVRSFPGFIHWRARASPNRPPESGYFSGVPCSRVCSERCSVGMERVLPRGVAMVGSLFFFFPSLGSFVFKNYGEHCCRRRYGFCITSLC